MTWVVAATSIFGYALVASDVRVTFRNGQERDCLQKIHPLGPYLLGGFAGSVQIGFRMTFFLNEQFAAVPAGSAWNLDIISATWLPRLLRRLFRESPEEERRLGCHLLIAAAHPNKVLGDLPYPRTAVYSYKSPTFDPLKAPDTASVAIGSGAGAYASAMQGLTTSFEFHQLALQGPQGHARHLAHSLYSVAKHDPRAGIGRLFLAGIVTRGLISIVKHELNEYSKDGVKTEIRIPSIAQDYRTFMEISRADGSDATGSCC